MTTPESPPSRIVRCPACSGPAVYEPSNPWRPFCGERCRQHDLGAWASESYRVGAVDDPDEPQETELPPH